MRALTEYNNRDQVGRVNMFLIFNIENSLSSPRGLLISPENMHNKNGLETKISRTIVDFLHLGHEFSFISGHGT